MNRKKRSRRGPRAVSAALLNASLAQRLQVLREQYVDAFAHYGDALDDDLRFLDATVTKLKQLDPDFQPSIAAADPTSRYAALRAEWLGQQLVVEQRAAIAHQRHTQIRDAVKPDSPAAALLYLRVSWVVVCRYAVVQQQVNDMFEHDRSYEDLPRCLLLRALDFPYVRCVTEAHVALSLSDNDLADYSLQLVFVAATLLCEALDNFGWSPSAGDYLQALFLRYALFVHAPADFLGDPYDLGPWEAEAGTGDPCLSPAPVVPAFLQVGERFFFHHLWRSHAAREMLPHPEAVLPLAVREKRAAWRKNVGLPALTRLILSLLTHDALADTVAARFSTMYPARLIWPGQREQLQFEYPLEAEDARPDAILFRLRIAHYKALQRFEREGKVDQSVARYVKQELALADVVGPEAPTEAEWLDEHVVRTRVGFDMTQLVDPERIVLLLFEIAFELRYAEVMRMQGTKPFVQHAYVDDRTLEKGRARPCYSRRILEQQRQQSDWPLFLAVWNTYCVAAPLQGLAARDVWAASVVHTTPHLIDALGLWLTLALRAPVSGERVLQAHDFATPDWSALAMPLELLA